jgi:hypothetical protein
VFLRIEPSPNSIDWILKKGVPISNVDVFVIGNPGWLVGFRRTKKWTEDIYFEICTQL